MPHWAQSQGMEHLGCCNHYSQPLCPLRACKRRVLVVADRSLVENIKWWSHEAPTTEAVLVMWVRHGQAGCQAASLTSSMILPAVELLIQTGCPWTSVSDGQIARPQRVMTTHQDQLATSLDSFVQAPLTAAKVVLWTLKHSLLLIVFMMCLLAVPTHLLNIKSFFCDKWLHR